jgi:glyoxylase-like metal-dependent hydrolase (beta-lactamase superfamily II)
MIWASSYDKSFLDEEQLPTTSLCRFMDMQTPKYTVGQWADDGQRLTFDGNNLNLVIYHTPGHTPDQIAIWDSEERVIFVGDTMYEWAHIIFPLEGDIRLYSETLEKLKTLVRGWNATANLNGGKCHMSLANFLPMFTINHSRYVETRFWNCAEPDKG